MREVSGYSIAALNGDIGHLHEFIVDDFGWLIRYLVVDTKNWIPAPKVLVAPRWVKAINYGNNFVAVDLNKETIRSAPEYDKDTLLHREYEERLYRHYGRSGYWEEDESREQRIAATSEFSPPMTPATPPAPHGSPRTPRTGRSPRRSACR